jgi:hypothetical protein
MILCPPFLYPFVSRVLDRRSRGLTRLFGIRWCFSRNLKTLLLLILFLFLLLNYGFAAILWGIARGAKSNYGVVCVGGSAQDEEGWFTFNDIVNLSWTTFTTVGYGNVFPVSQSRDMSSAALLFNYSNSDVAVGENLCVLLTVVLLIESFVGVMFTSFAAALFFGKIMSLQRHASVEFSTICVVRTSEEQIDVDDELEWPVNNSERNVIASASSNISHSNSNVSLSTMGGLPATITNASANALPPAAPSRASSAPNPPKRPSARLSTTATPPNSVTAFPILEFRLVNTNYGVPGSQILKAELSVSVGTCYREGHTKAMSERNANVSPSSNDGAFVGIKSPAPSGHTRYYPLSLELPVHPLFTKLFYGRHTLDLNSPLLTKNAKKQIKIHTRGRGWPRFMNSDKGLRDSIIDFETIIVVINGMEVSGGDVFGMQSYSMDDLRLHGTFSTMYNHDQNDRFEISRINDFVESENNDLEYLSKRHKLFNFIDENSDEGDERNNSGDGNGNGNGHGHGNRPNSVRNGSNRSLDSNGGDSAAAGSGVTGLGIEMTNWVTRQMSGSVSSFVSRSRTNTADSQDGSFKVAASPKPRSGTVGEAPSSTTSSTSAPSTPRGQMKCTWEMVEDDEEDYNGSNHRHVRWERKISFASSPDGRSALHGGGDNYGGDDDDDEEGDEEEGDEEEDEGFFDGGKGVAKADSPKGGLSIQTDL